ncbi:MAG: hypothetical protein MUC84_08625, partial [Solirubrobacteraceae bacterium]|nr:hypothetical protein [Solirubrobacteraceae bacterium]
MALAGAWIAFPLVLALLALGWGLLVEIAAGRRLPGALLPGLGVAALAVVMSPLTADPATAELTLPVVVGGAFAGLGLLVAGAGPRTGLAALRPTPATAATGVAAAAVYLAPVVLSGAPAISGYIRLDDSATWIAIADHVLTSGRDVAGLAPSTHQAALASYLSSFYPAGSLLPLAAAGRLAGQDLAWVWAPYLGGLGVALALALSVLLRAAVPQAAARVAVAVCASASALLFGYVLWGGVKEVAIAALTATAAALVPWTLAGLTGERRATWGSALRALSPLAVCAAAIASTVSIAGVVWIGPVLAALVLGAIAGVGGARRALRAVREAAAAR